MANGNITRVEFENERINALQNEIDRRISQINEDHFERLRAMQELQDEKIASLHALVDERYVSVQTIMTRLESSIDRHRDQLAELALSGQFKREYALEERAITNQRALITGVIISATAIIVTIIIAFVSLHGGI